MRSEGPSVWIYIAMLLMVYGVALTCGGIYQWFHLPSTVLAQYHATFWAGIGLLVAGAALAATAHKLRRRL